MYKYNYRTALRWAVVRQRRRHGYRDGGFRQLEFGVLLVPKFAHCCVAHQLRQRWRALGGRRQQGEIGGNERVGRR